jgi:hypothetical protein
MFPNQFFIVKNLIRFLYALKFKNPNLEGVLISESDFLFGTLHRRPDIGYFTDEQILDARNNQEVLPFFVI